MKKITLTLVAIACTLASYAQTGATCNDAIPESATNTCVFTNYTTSGLEMWFSWTATGTDAQIIVVNQAAFGTNVPHLHNIALFDGTCGNLNQLEEDELPFLNPAAELTIDASNLIVGNTYYIRVKILASAAACTQGACPGIANSSFDLCIQDIDVFIPLDFNLNNFGFQEVPVNANTYYSNDGQIIDINGNPRLDVKSYTIGANPALFITDNSLMYVFARIDTDITTIDTLHRIDMRLVGGNPAVRAFRTEKTSEHINYFLGHIPNGIVNKRGYSRIVCSSVYPNIDMQYYSNSNGLKYYFIVHPGGDADDIIMRFDGASAVDVTGTGGLRITTSLGNIEFEAAHAYQINKPGTIVPMPWQAEFVKVSANEVKFDIRNYPKNKPLIIQVDRGHTIGASAPHQGIKWSSFYGSINSDRGTGLYVDLSKNQYLYGFSWSINLPGLFGVVQTYNSGNQDVFVAKFNELHELDWATFYGGMDNEDPTRIVVDGAGNVYFIGGTFSSNFPLFDPGAPAFFRDFSSGLAGFIVVLNNQGDTKLWATHFTPGIDIVIDGSGNIFIVGFGNVDIVAPFGAYSQSTGGSGFISKFNSSFNQVWSTQFGGGTDYINSVDVDNTGNIYITGYTSAPLAGAPLCDVPTNGGFPLCNPGGNAYYQDTKGDVGGGLHDAFVAVFDNNNSLIYSTYFGGDGDDRSNAITVDAFGNIYIAGKTTSATPASTLCGVPATGRFPLCDPPSSTFFQDNLWGSSDAFFAGFNGAKEPIVSMYYGGPGGEEALDITTDDAGRVYFVGTTWSSDSFPVEFRGPYYNQDMGLGFIPDGFIVQFNANQQRVWASYLGISGTASINSVVVRDNNKIFFSGYVQGFTDNFPIVCSDTASHYCQQQMASHPNSDAVIGKHIVDNPVGIDEYSQGLTDNDLLIYPNPTSGNINIQLNLDQKQNIVISVYSVIGELLYSEKHENKSGKFNKQLDVSALSDGMYLVLLQTGEKMIARKLIIQ
ncbi:MAG: hypothetical protein COC01_07540 [Bacteroidetes bacterium]|nr:MAG: hypothetical protein COC01_07540 [Bacteroidota bacterium]